MNWADLIWNEWTEVTQIGVNGMERSGWHGVEQGSPACGPQTGTGPHGGRWAAGEGAKIIIHNLALASEALQQAIFLSMLMS